MPIRHPSSPRLHEPIVATRRHGPIADSPSARPTPGAFSEERARGLRATLEEALGVPFSEGNRIRPLRNGVEIFPAMLEAIRSAERTVEFETFIYWKGDVAHAFARALRDAAERGADVRVLLDAVGSIPMSEELLEILDSSPVQVRRYGRIKPWEFWKIDHRTHRKILICDATVGFTGGVGIAEEWEGDARTPDEWRETHFHIEGPSVRALRGVFAQHWWAAGGSEFPLDHRRDLPEEEAVDDGVPAQVIRSTAGTRWSDTASLLRTVVAMARERLRITTAYFVPDDVLVEMLREAAGRGVEVEVMTPGPHTDHRLCKLAGEATFAALLEAGVKLLTYQPTMLHAKIITVDSLLSVIGSANFNHRSMHKDDELSILVLDPELAASLDRDFERDREGCEELEDASVWKDGRSFPRRAASKLSHLFRREL